MKNLFTLDELSVLDITEILEEALAFKKGKDFTDLKGKKVANLFFENSTRTHYSFIVAEQNLRMIDTNFNAAASSVKKGESLYDTIKTFEAIGFDAVVIRHPQNNYFNQLENIILTITIHYFIFFLFFLSIKTEKTTLKSFFIDRSCISFSSKILT